jgi:DNA-binding NtrC family response regulator/serine/threonine protein kinase/tetratricopeptide (TPR) repeat protein
MGTVDCLELPRCAQLRLLRKDGSKKTYLMTLGSDAKKMAIVKVLGRFRETADLRETIDVCCWYRTYLHPSIAPLRDVRVSRSGHCHVLRDYFPGSPFQLGPNQIGALIHAVSFLHLAGRYHGAIKPTNISSQTHSSQRVVLLDPYIPNEFSHALRLEDLQFEAPELRQGKKPNAETDMYSLGCLLYWTLTGKHVFEDTQPTALIEKHRHAEPTSLSRIAPHVPVDLANIIQGLLSKDPAHRRDPFTDLKKIYPDPSRPLTAPLIGRNTEIAAAVNFVRQNKGLRLLILEGELGIGKTRLLAELEHRLVFRHCRFIAVRTSESDSVPVFDRFRKVLIELQNRDGMPSLSWNSEYSTDGDTSSTDSIIEERAIVEITRVLASISRQVPTVLAIDGIEGLDERTLKLISYLALRADDLVVTVVLTKRPSTAWPSALIRVQSVIKLTNILRIDLGPLTASEMRQMAVLLKCNSVEPATSAASGNPLFLELMTSISEKGHPQFHALDPFIKRMMADIPKAQLRQLQVLAAFGDAVDVTLFRSMVGIDAARLNEHLQHLTRCGLVQVTDGQIMFRSGRIRRIVDSRMGAALKRKLHATIFRKLAGSSDTWILAHHARSGNLHSDAIEYFERSADAFFLNRDFNNAAKAFLEIEKLARILGRPVSVEHQIRRAACCTRLGRHKEAKSVLRTLLTAATEAQEPAYIGRIYKELANFSMQTSPADRAKILESASTYLPGDSDPYLQVQSQLAQVEFQNGHVDRAFSRLAQLEEAVAKAPVSSNVTASILSAKTYVLVSVGQHKQALEILRKAVVSTPALSCLVKTNAAVCYEHLGSLVRAEQLQAKARSIAERIGFIRVVFASLANLATFAVKQGELQKARMYFEEAAALVRRQTQSDSEFGLEATNCVQADEALLRCASGEWGEAKRLIDSAWRTAQSSLMEPHYTYVGLLVCEVYAQLNQSRYIQDFLAKFDSELLNWPYYRVEIALLRVRGSDDTMTAIKTLDDALAITYQLGTKHQRCRVLLGLAEFNLLNGNRKECWKNATRAFAIANRYGYKTIKVRALLLKGHSTDVPRDVYKSAFVISEEIGSPELIAETAYHVGATALAHGNCFEAYQHLVKSSSLLGSLVEHVPKRYRNDFLQNVWRADVKRRLDECISKLVLAASLQAPTRVSSDISLIRCLYRISVCDATWPNIATVAETLVHAMADTWKVAVTGFIKSNNNITWYSNVTVGDELKKQICRLAEDCKIRPAPDSIHVLQTHLWVPLQSLQVSGGVYLERQARSSSLVETEIEYLTVLRDVVNATFDRMQSRLTTMTTQTAPIVFYGIVGKSKLIKEVFRHIEIAANSPATVLIEGESGTGKELVARAIHDSGNRAKGPFVPVDCGAIPETLIESELFGSRKGSFTGAVTDRPGLFEAAHGGTIFLDEISNTSAAVQVRLLRVIQEKEVRRIGETKGRSIDVRLIAATNTSLESLVQQRQFRQDLLFRLKVLHIKVPPLRNRRDDIPALVDSFIARLNSTHKTKKHVTAAFLQELSLRTFSGNVRELQNLVERAYVFAKGSAISVLPADGDPTAETVDEVSAWFKDLTEGRKDFWSAIHDRYKRRDIPREKVIALVDLGLRSTRGSYKTLAAMFRVEEGDYRRFMDFLRRNSCRLDFRPYRKLAP